MRGSKTNSAVGRSGCAAGSEVARGFAHVAARPRQVIECGENWKMWVLCDREPVRHWVDGRVVLLGDAAHPMLQYLAQGACMALEDAVNLAHHLAAADDIEAAFAAYNAERFIRTGRVQLKSRLMGEYVPMALPTQRELSAL